MCTFIEKISHTLKKPTLCIVLCHLLIFIKYTHTHITLFSNQYICLFYTIHYLDLYVFRYNTHILLMQYIIFKLMHWKYYIQFSLIFIG